MQNDIATLSNAELLLTETKTALWDIQSLIEEQEIRTAILKTTANDLSTIIGDLKKIFQNASK